MGSVKCYFGRVGGLCSFSLFFYLFIRMYVCIYVWLNGWGNKCPAEDFGMEGKEKGREEQRRIVMYMYIYIYIGYEYLQ